LIKINGIIEQEYNKIQKMIKKKIMKCQLPALKGVVEVYTTEEMEKYKDNGYIYM